MNKNYCVFDIGGTNTRLAISRDGHRVEKVLTAPTQSNYQRGLLVVSQLYNKLFGHETAKLVAGGIAGTFNKTKTQTLNCPQLSGWVGKPIQRDLSKIFHCPVSLENDAALGGLGEAIMGAGKKASVVGYFTVGTEVGGSRIVDGRVDRVAFGFEPGKQLFLRGRKWTTLEEIIGGKGIAKKYHLKPEAITDQTVWGELRKYLVLGLRNAIAFWSPDVMILGGSVMNKLWPLTINKQLSSGLIWPPIKRGQLGDRATLLGALAYLKKRGRLHFSQQ